MEGDGLEQLTPRERELYDAVMGVTPPRKITVGAAMIGLKGQSGHNYWNRVRTKLGYNPIAQWKALNKLPAQRNGKSEQVESLRRVMPETLRRLTEMRLEEALREMKAKSAEASYAELARAAKDLNMTRAQLAGEPTQILSVDARVKMMGVLQLVNAEAMKRGMVKVQGDTGELTSYKKLPEAIDAEVT